VSHTNSSCINSISSSTISRRRSRSIRSSSSRRPRRRRCTQCTKLKVSTLPDVAVSNETVLQLIAFVGGGTYYDDDDYYYYYYYYSTNGVVVSANWGDGYASAASCSDGSDICHVVYDYIYETPGTFTVSVTARNLVSSTTAYNQTIAVCERIRGCSTLLVLIVVSSSSSN